MSKVDFKAEDATKKSQIFALRDFDRKVFFARRVEGGEQVEEGATTMEIPNKEGEALEYEVIAGAVGVIKDVYLKTRTATVKRDGKSVEFTVYKVNFVIVDPTDETEIVLHCEFNSNGVSDILRNWLSFPDSIFQISAQWFGNYKGIKFECDAEGKPELSREDVPKWGEMGNPKDQFEFFQNILKDRKEEA